MNKLLSFFAISMTMLLFSSCSNDEETLSLTVQELRQTTWNIDFYKYAGEDSSEEQESGVVQFRTETEGWYIIAGHSGGNQFDYQVDDKLITITDSPLSGTWTVIEKAKDRMVLYTYLPTERKAILTKKY